MQVHKKWIDPKERGNGDGLNRNLQETWLLISDKCHTTDCPSLCRSSTSVKTNLWWVHPTTWCQCNPPHNSDKTRKICGISGNFSGHRLAGNLRSVESNKTARWDSSKCDKVARVTKKARFKVASYRQTDPKQLAQFLSVFNHKISSKPGYRLTAGLNIREHREQFYLAISPLWADIMSRKYKAVTTIQQEVICHL